MAPEVIEGKSDFDYRVDIWAIAVVVAEKALKTELFPGDYTTQVYKQIIQFKEKSEKILVPHNSFLNGLLVSMLQTDPENRPFAKDILQQIECKPKKRPIKSDSSEHTKKKTKLSKEEDSSE